jgi:hypothetical protein
MSAESQKCEASTDSRLLGNGSAKTRVVNNIFRNTQQWSNSEDVFSTVSVPIATWCNNRRTVGRCAFYAIRAERNWQSSGIKTKYDCCYQFRALYYNTFTKPQNGEGLLAEAECDYVGTVYCFTVGCVSTDRFCSDLCNDYKTLKFALLKDNSPSVVWKCKFAFLTNIYGHLKDVNSKLQEMPTCKCSLQQSICYIMKLLVSH